MKYSILILLAVVSFSANAALIQSTSDASYSLLDQTISHSGRTDSSGCHNDTKKGTRHCH